MEALRISRLAVLVHRNVLTPDRLHLKALGSMSVCTRNVTTDGSIIVANSLLVNLLSLSMFRDRLELIALIISRSM